MVDGVAVDPETGEILDPADPVEEGMAAAMGAEGDAEPEPDEDPDEEPEPEPEPEPTGLTEREMDKEFKSLETRVGTFRTYVAGFAERTGQPLIQCTLCLDGVPGYFLHPDVQPLPADKTEATKALLGLPVDRPLLDDDKSNACPKCGGWGDVKTGSKVHGETVAKCLECKGRGWVGERSNRTPAEVAAGLTVPALELGVTEEEPLLVDSWDTPVGHPDFGKLPQYRAPGWAEALENYKRGNAAPLPDPITVGG
jgi:hypothetical protein